MNNAHELMEQLRQDGAAQYQGTDLAHDHRGVTRRVRRDRAVRTSLVAVTGVAAAGGIAFGATHLGGATVLTPATGGPSPTDQVSTPSAMLTVSVTKQERIEKIAQALGQAYGATEDQAMDALVVALPPEANGNAEGWVVAGDYAFDPADGLDGAAHELVSTMTTHLESANVPREQWLDTVILASIVQQEAPAGPSDQAGVARVLLNRLDAGKMLQVESPLAYYLHVDTHLVSDDGWAVDTPFNTFMYEGLPPSAIGASTMEALDAALNPAAGDWMYFLRTPDGNVLLFTTFDEFAVAVDQYFPGTGASD